MRSETSFDGNNFGFQVGANHGSITAQFSSIAEETDRLCIRALRCPDSLVVKNRLKETKDKLLSRSIEWMLQDPQYKSWQNGDDVCLLWIKGGAGKGKTMMSIGIIEELSRLQHESTVVTYFFCQSADYELNTLEAIIKGLILQLVNQQPMLKQSLRRRWDTMNNRFDEDVTSWRALWNIFLEMLERCKCRRVYMIVDALDECQDDGMADFLKLIVRNGLDRPAKIKWMLTSRPLDSAERQLLAGHEQVRVSLELNSKYVSEAVKTYISYKAEELSLRHRYGEALKREIQTQLTEKAEGTFLWVSLVCKKLESVCRAEALTTIQTLPPGLHPFYDRIFGQLSTAEPANVQRYMRLLKVMMLAFRPLKVEEVGSVTGLTDGEDAIRALVDRCASFIKMQENNIQFVHQSARDYLAGENGRSILDSHEYFGHGEIALGCLSYLSKWLHVNFVELPQPDSTREALKALKDEKRNMLLASVDYAATFWMQHLEESKRNTIVQCGLSENGAVSTFLRTKLLEWLECLSLLDKLPRAIEALNALAKLAKDSYLALTLVQDATRFLLRHYHTMANWPLQIYSSAVIFSPISSVVRSENMDKIPRWLRKTTPMEDNWASLVQTLAGHTDSVAAVAFSPDGKQIASGSHDTTIKLWDATTGDFQKTLAGHTGWVTAVAFSPDGKQIASGSWDNTIKLWDATTGDVQKTLAGHTGRVTAVAFSPHGKQIVSGSSDTTIKLWDTTIGDVQKTLAGHTDSVAAVAFSPHGKQIVSCSDDNTIKLWDATTGDFQKTLAGHTISVAAVAFSPDGKQIASGSHDTTIKLWDATIGDVQKTLAGHTGWVTAVAFSPHGKQIVSGSSDTTIKLWDATIGDVQKTLAGHTISVAAVAFSPDGKQIASGSHDTTIKLWDATAGDVQKTLAGHTGWVTAVAFSPDGKWIVSRSDDNTIKLWDATTGDFQKTLADHTISVAAVAFSPDGKQIASGSHDTTIKLWDATIGDVQKTLAGHSGPVTAVAFSPHGKQIVSCSSDDTIKLWDATTGAVQKTLAGHSGWVTAVAFSPDGKQIVSGSSDNTIKLWDATTGDVQKTLTGHTGPVTAVAFSPDSKQIASGSWDNTIKLWDIAKSLKASKYLVRTLSSRLRFRSWREIKTSGRIYAIKFSANSQYLITNIGLIKLVNPSDGHTTTLESFQDIHVRNQWICYGDMPLIRIPSDFVPACVDAQGDQLAIGSRNGQVLSFNIDRTSLQSMMGSRSRPSQTSSRRSPSFTGNPGKKP